MSGAYNQFSSWTKCNPNSIKKWNVVQQLDIFQFPTCVFSRNSCCNDVTFQWINKTEAALQNWLEEQEHLLPTYQLIKHDCISFYADVSFREENDVLKVRDQTRLPRDDFIFLIFYNFYISYFVISFISKVRDQTRLPRDDANFPFLRSPLQIWVLCFCQIWEWPWLWQWGRQFSGNILSENIYIDVGIASNLSSDQKRRENPTTTNNLQQFYCRL